MSSIQHHAVSPKLPTTLADQTHLDLPGHDIIPFRVNTVYVIPTELDVPRFKEALSRVLQLYPHAAGRLQYVDRRWTIELTNTAVPLNIKHKLDSSSGSFLNGNEVFQYDTFPFIGIQPFSADPVNDSTPLLCVELTIFHNETCVGVAWNHSLGDATVRFRFLHTLSQFYQNLSAEFPTPSFKKDHFAAPSDSVVAEIWPHIPFLHEFCSLYEPPPPMKSFEPVNWRIDNREIEELRSILSSKIHNGPSLSKQDCITAYLVAVLNCTRSSPLQSVGSAASYRHVKAPFITENAAGNMFMPVITSVPTDMAGIAAAVRNSLIRCRDPDYTSRWVSVTSHLQSEAWSALKRPLAVNVDDQLEVNSITKIDWCSVHFGCPDGTQFHASGSGLYRDAARVARSNPVKGADGVWQARQSVDITVGVAPEVKHKVLEILARGVRYMLEDQL